MFGRPFCQVDEMIELVQLRWAHLCAHVLDGIGTILDSGHDLIGMTDRRIGDRLVLQLHSVGETFAARILGITFVSVVVLR